LLAAYTTVNGYDDDDDDDDNDGDDNDAMLTNKRLCLHLSRSSRRKVIRNNPLLNIVRQTVLT